MVSELDSGSSTFTCFGFFPMDLHANERLVLLMQLMLLYALYNVLKNSAVYNSIKNLQ